MKKYAYVQGERVIVFAAVPDFAALADPDYIEYPFPDGADPADYYFDGVAVKFDDRPKPAPLADWPLIKSERNRRELLPLDVGGGYGVFDVDEVSIRRMEFALREFSQLPTLNADGTLTWKRADNSYINLTQADLQAVYDGAILALAQRAARLHARAEQLRAQLPHLTQASVLDDATWA